MAEHPAAGVTLEAPVLLNVIDGHAGPGAEPVDKGVENRLKSRP